MNKGFAAAHEIQDVYPIFNNSFIIVMDGLCLKRRKWIDIASNLILGEIRKSLHFATYVNGAINILRLASAIG